MADKYIKKINLGTAASPDNYDIYDEYCRRRLEGLSNVYSISCQHAGSSSNSYVDYITGESITFSTMAIANTSFNSANETITVTKTTGKTTYIVLESKTTAGAYYAVRFLDMNLGDTVYVVESKVGTTTIPDRWLSNYVEDTSATFTVLDGKIDLKEYAKKTEAGKAGTYTTSGPTPDATGSAGAQTAAGTASVTYKKSGTSTGAAGGETVTSTSAGGATVSGSNFTFTGTAGDVSVSSDAVTLNDHSYTPAGTISKVEAAAHTHTATQTVAAANQATVVTGYPNFSGGSFTQGTDTFTQGTLPSLTVSTKKVPVTTETSAFTVVKGVAADGTETVNTGYTHTDPTFNSSDAFITGYPNFNGGSLSNPGTYIKTLTSNYGFDASTSNIMTTPTVTEGVLSWTLKTAGSATSAGSTGAISFTAASLGTPSTATALTSIKTAGGITSAGTATVLTGVKASATTTLTPTNIGSASNWSAGSLPTFTQGSDSHTPASLGTASTEVVIKSLPSITIGNGGGISVTPTFTGTAATLAHAYTAATAVELEGSFTPAGTIGGSQTIAGHTHSVTTSDHSHSITLSDATATGDVSVAISDHTHTLSGHTHTVTVPNCAA